MNYDKEKEIELEMEEEFLEEGTEQPVPSEMEEPEEYDSPDDADDTDNAEDAEEISIPAKAVSKRKKRKKKHYLLKFVVLIALCTATYFFLHSGIFTVEKIVLEENDYMTKEVLKEKTGYKKGMNLFEIDKRANEKKLEEESYIKEAKIKRQLPGTISVTLTLREKTAVIKSDEGYVLIDNENIVIDVTEDMPEYTLLDGLKVTDAKAGKKIEVKQTEKFEQYLEMLKLISDADMYFKKLVIDGNEIKAYAADGLYCTGTLENVKKGLEDGSLQAIFYDLMKKDIRKGVVTVGDDQYYSYSK